MKDAPKVPVAGEQFQFDKLEDWQSANRTANAIGLIGYVTGVTKAPTPWVITGRWVTRDSIDK